MMMIIIIMLVIIICKSIIGVIKNRKIEKIWKKYNYKKIKK